MPQPGFSEKPGYQAAREAFNKGRMDRFHAHAAKVPQDHLLAPYIQYWRLKSNSPAVEDQLAFIGRYPDSQLSDRVRAAIGAPRAAGVTAQDV